jgi:hypothetical protein
MVGEIGLAIVYGGVIYFLVKFCRHMQIELDKLKRENLTMAKHSVAQSQRMDRLRDDIADFTRKQQNSLTSAATQPKIVAKPKPVTWKAFRSAAEKKDEEPEE